MQFPSQEISPAHQTSIKLRLQRSSEEIVVVMGFSLNVKLLQMTVPDSSSFYTITNPQQAQLLSEPKSKEFFKPFLAQERSVTQAAQELGCNLNTMLYRVKILQAAKLIKVTRREKRKGREIKYYRSIHNAYFIPFQLTSYATLEERLEAQAEPIFANLINAYAHALKQNERFGNYLLRGLTGGVITTDFVPDFTPSGLPIVYSDMITSLSKQEALAIAEGLRDFFRQGSGASGQPKRPDSRHHNYLLMVAFLPVNE
jgi:Helix-turn-helix domain